MAWPIVDILPPPSPVGADWVYSPALSRGAAVKAEGAWSQNTVRRWGEPLVPNLYTVRLGGGYRADHWFAHADVSAASWDGPIGLASPRLVVGYTNDRVVAHAAATAPLTTFNALIGAQAWAYDAAVSVGDSWYRVTLGGTQRAFPTEYWQPSTYAAAGVRYKGFTVEARGEQDLKRNRIIEAGASYGWKGQCYQVRPSVAGGLSSSIGTPSVRIRVAVQYGCGPKAPTIAMGLVESHLWIEADQAQPVPLAEAPVYPTPHESIGGFLTANPQVTVYIRTNLSETQAQRALAVFVAKGLKMSQIERTDHVPYVAGEQRYLDFVVIRGNKNSEATDAPVEVVP